MTAVTEEEVDRVAARLTALETEYRRTTMAPTVTALHGIEWRTVGADLVASVAKVPVMAVPWSVLLDPETDGVIPTDPTPDVVPEDW